MARGRKGKVASNTQEIKKEAVEEENIVELMKEVSMQEEVELPAKEIKVEVEEVFEEPILIGGGADEEPIIEEVVEEKVDEEPIIEEVVEEPILIGGEVKPIEEEVSIDKMIEEAKTTEEVKEEVKPVEEPKKEVKVNNNTKPRMTYQQMMGYEWNGQNFEYV